MGAFDPADGTLRGAAVNETLSPRGSAVHLHCDDPDLGRALLDRALSKAAAAGRRTSQVSLHPASTAQAIWGESSWPVRTTADPEAGKRAAQTETNAEPEPEHDTKGESGIDAGPEAEAATAPPVDEAVSVA